MKVYFDTNIFDHILKRVNLTDGDLESLLKSVSSKKITILLSILNIEEMISIFKSKKEFPHNEIRLLLNLTSWQNGLIKQYDEIIKEDIKNYISVNNKTEYMWPASIIHSNLDFLTFPNELDKKEIKEIIYKTQKQKEDFLSKFIQYREQVDPFVKELKGRYPSFDEFKNPLIKNFALQIAKGTGLLSEEIEIDIDSILKIRSIKLYSETSLSLVYSQIFEKRTPKIGDSRDLLHTILATPADMFITNDRSFLNILKRITVENMRFQNLKEFIIEYC